MLATVCRRRLASTPNPDPNPDANPDPNPDPDLDPDPGPNRILIPNPKPNPIPIPNPGPSPSPHPHPNLSKASLRELYRVHERVNWLGSGLNSSRHLGSHQLAYILVTLEQQRTGKEP